MENYKVKRNPKPLSDEQINRHKDFNKLLNNQQKLYRYKDATKPLYKNFGFLSFVLLIGVVLLVLVLENRDQPTTEPKSDSLVVAFADTGMKIVPESPLPENTSPENNGSQTNTVATNQENTKGKSSTAVIYEDFAIDPEKGTVLYTSSGMRLLVPSFAFADKMGNLYKKQIIIRLREMPTSLSEPAIKKAPAFVPSAAFEILALEAGSMKKLAFAKPLVLERIIALKEGPGLLHYYAIAKENWEAAEEEKVSYRFTIQANDTEFPELELLKQLAWEVPASAGKPADFGYIFSRPWKGFSFKTTDKKELAVKNSNSSYKGVLDLAPILGDATSDKELRNAFYDVYNFSTGKNTDKEQQQQSLTKIENWKNSEAGKKYQQWMKDAQLEKQFYAGYKISKHTLSQPGYYSVVYTPDRSASSSVAKRVLLLTKYPERSQHFSEELIQQDPSLRR
jgi:hypothetical protein